MAHQHPGGIDPATAAQLRKVGIEPLFVSSAPEPYVKRWPIAIGVGSAILASLALWGLIGFGLDAAGDALAWIFREANEALARRLTAPN